VLRLACADPSASGEHSLDAGGEALAEEQRMPAEHGSFRQGRSEEDPTDQHRSGPRLSRIVVDGVAHSHGKDHGRRHHRCPHPSQGTRRSQEMTHAQREHRHAAWALAGDEHISMEQRWRERRVACP